jgi:putative acetyltransferase
VALPSIVCCDPRQPEIADLLKHADAYSASLYPEEGRHPVDLTFLAGPNVRFFVARNGATAVGCGALVIDAEGVGELKRMIVHPDARGQGVGRSLLDAIEAAARFEGIDTLRLETGPGNREALNLYRCGGYIDRGPFGTYRAGPHSLFMQKKLPRVR